MAADGILTHNCNARCHHCHRGAAVAEQLATPARLLEVCRELISLDYPDERHDAFREIPGLFARIRTLAGALDARDRRGVVLTTVLQGDNFREALAIARLAHEWGVNVNFSAYTALRTSDRSLMIAGDDVGEFAQVIEELIGFKNAHHHVLTSDWVLRGMVRFYANGGQLGRCRAGERMVAVNPDGTLSPCDLLVRGYATRRELRRQFTAHNDCSHCYTSTRGNAERPFKYLLLDHVDHLRRRAEA